MNELNPPQQQAVKHIEGPLLILAGAGSGKTHVITNRIVHLLRAKMVPAANILAVTFTNKAAREMKERVDAIAGKMAEGIVISTFHSLGVRILRRDIRSLGFKPNFSIYSSSDQAGVLRQAMRELNLDPKVINPDRVIWQISALKSRLISPKDFNPSKENPLELATALIYPRYQELLKGFNAIDFDDIIMLAVKLLQTGSILEFWQDRFRYIMVDEYQDTNASQYLMISLLAKKTGNLCVVGDDDQSIYGWRGAEIENILNFERDHPGCKVIKLEQNYRSTVSILEVANKVISNNKVRTDKALWSSGDKGREIDLIEAVSEEDEAVRVVDGILQAQFCERLLWSDMAVLYRSNAQSRAFEEQLRMQRIPYVVVGGMQFYERKEVKDAVAYLRVIENPNDEASLLRIINFPRRGIGDNTLVRLNQWSMEHNVPLFDALGRVSEIPDIGESARKAVLSFHSLMQGIIKEFNVKARLGEQVNVLFNRLRIDDEMYRTLNDAALARKRIENIEQVVNSLATFEEQNPYAGLSGFLERISLMDEDRSDNDKEHGRNSITLMSLHSSKGLEFSYVWLVGLEEDLLPHKRSVEEDPTCSEERRLCYVGITRARRHLTISRCLTRRKYGVVEERQPSRFLAEIPEHLLNNLSAGDSGRQGDPDDMAADFFARMLKD